VTTSGDLAALLGGASVVRAHADIRDWADPHATLAAWSTGPWAAEAAAGDPGLFGMPNRPYTDATRQWLDLDRDRAREERGSYLIVKDGPRWWSGTESGTEPESTVEACALDLSLERDEGSRLIVTAVAREDNAYAPALAPLGWGASRWELVVDSVRGVLLGTTAYAGDTVFRRVEADVDLDVALADSLFAPPG
jgi:hypothetical protein